MAQSKQLNGYLQLGNGLTLQWGRYQNADQSCNSNAERTYTLNFPKTMTKVPWVILTCATSIRLIASSHDYTVSGFTWKLYNPSPSTYNGLYFDWLAIFL